MSSQFIYGYNLGENISTDNYEETCKKLLQIRNSEIVQHLPQPDIFSISMNNLSRDFIFQAPKLCKNPRRKSHTRSCKTCPIERESAREM